jgi:hypothetical protein
MPPHRPRALYELVHSDNPRGVHDPRQHYPATVRNREPILGVLESVLSDLDVSRPVLEIASGTGEHAVYFAENLPALVFQPSDPDPALRASIEAHRTDKGLPNLRAPVALDVMSSPWPIPSAAAVLCINMIHIAPFAACEALFRGASAVLAEGAPLYLYGPFRMHGEHTAESNRTFDESLRARDPRWGVRDLEAVVELAARHGFELGRTEAMPANNLSVIFVRS